MRPIDADKLKTKTHYMDKGFHGVMGVTEEDIDGMETLKVIPIPWLEGIINECSKNTEEEAPYIGYVLESTLNTWNKTKDTFKEILNKEDDNNDKKTNNWTPIKEEEPKKTGIYLATILYEGEYYVERLLYSKGKWMPIDSLNFVGIKGVIAWKDDDYYKGD